MAFFCVLSIRGTSTPFAVLLTSSIALAAAGAPVVLILKDCDTAVWCKVIAKDMANTKRKNFVIQKLIKIKKINSCLTGILESFLQELGLVWEQLKTVKLIFFLDNQHLSANYLLRS